MTFEGVVLAFIFLGLCIFVHELGHFLAAKWRGLHIVAFSIGFKKIWGFKHKGIDYRIGCIPCGGYVDLPQIDATGEAKDEHGNPLPAAKPIDRIITALAGPLFNILFGILLSVFVWWIGVPQDTPTMTSITVTELEKFSPEYKAGLRNGDVITQINGKSFNGTWGDFVRDIIFTNGKVSFTVKRDGKTFDVTYKPIPNPGKTKKENIAYPFFLPVIPLECEVIPGTDVAKAGMKTGDIILELNGKKMDKVEKLVQKLMMNTGEDLHFTVKRGDKLIELKSITPKGEFKELYLTGIRPADSFNALVIDVTPSPSPEIIKDIKTGDHILKIDDKIVTSEYQLQKLIAKKKGKPIALLLKRDKDIIQVSKVFPIDKDNPDARVDLDVSYKYSFPLWISSMTPGSPSEKQGFKQFDRLLELNKKPIDDLQKFINDIHSSKGKSMPVVIERNGVRMNKTLTAHVFHPFSAQAIGMQLFLTAHPTPWQQFKRVITLTYKSLRGVFSSESTLSPSNFSGPLGIVKGISVTFTAGSWMPVLALIVLITYSLALLNIMPLPVLDGGHIVLALIEQIFGKPLSPKIVQPLFVIFIFLLVSMMIYVSFHDTVKIVDLKTEEYQFMGQPPEAIQPIK